ncbi:MAG: SPFH domain-containing protein [Myxococcota bacterium]
MEVILVVGSALVLVPVAIVLIVKKLIYLCQPNEVLVFSGTRRRVGGRTVGYRLVQGGRGFRVPLLETVGKLDLTNMIIDVRVTGAYSKGGIPLNVAAVANVKIASNEPTIGNAIERFLGKHREDIVRVAKETLEGNLRGVLATLTPEEVNQDRVKFAQNLLQEADTDLKKLGLTLDTLKIQNVTDDKGYLDSIGRKQSAALLMRSRVAEAENKALAAERNAANYQTRTVAKIDADIAMARAEASRRIADARTKKSAMIAEQRAEVTAMIARADAELAVQRARIDQVRLKLTANWIKPAESRRSQSVEEARAEHAGIVEEGKATAQSLRAVAASWRRAGADARRIFVAQKLGTLVDQLMDTVEDMPIDRITVIDQHLGDGIGTRAKVSAEQLKETVGVDVPALLNRLGGNLAGGAFGTLPEPNR